MKLHEYQAKELLARYGDLAGVSIDADMFGNRLVIADDLHSKAQPRTVDRPAGQEDNFKAGL